MSDTKKTAARGKAYEGFSPEEIAAMKDHAQDLKTAARRGSKAAKADGEADVLAKLAGMQESDRVMGGRLHALITTSAPELSPKLWYGMPAYYKDDKLVCHFQPAEKFKTRYPTLGFSDNAHLDDGAIWPVAYALTKLTDAGEKRISALVKQAVS